MSTQKINLTPEEQQVIDAAKAKIKKIRENASNINAEIKSIPYGDVDHKFDLIGDIEWINDKAERLQRLTGNNAENLANCEQLMYDMKGFWYAKIIDHPKYELMGANERKAWVEGKMSDAFSTQRFCDRVGSALVHSLEILRSQMSLYKSEKYSQQ